MDGRVRPTHLDGDRPPAPARAPTQLADPRLLVGRHARRRTPRTAGALLQTRQRLALRGRGLPPAAHPLPDRRLRHVRPGRGLGERLTALNDTTNDVAATARGEAGSMVRHSGPP